MVSIRGEALKNANAYLMLSCNDKRSHPEQRENRGHQGPAFLRPNRLRRSPHTSGANHRENQRQSARNREEIQSASTSGQLQRNLQIEQELKAIKASIEAESISYGELAFLEAHRTEILELGDQALAEWDGIPEDEFKEAKDGN